MIIYIEAAGCTNTCRHCYVDGHFPYGDFFTLDELRMLRKAWGALTIYYEPTAYSAFPEVYDESITAEHGHGGWLVTNGFGLARREDYSQLFDKMSKMGIHTVALTLHGLQEHHDWFVCQKGAYDDVLLATRRAKAAGFRLNWQIFIDRKGIGDVPRLVDIALKECDAPPQLSIPAHRVGGRLQHFEAMRPTLTDVYKWHLHQLVDDPSRNCLMDPEALTTAAWMERWRKNPAGDEFKHVFEPRAWPASLSYDLLNIRIRKDRQMFLDPMCSSPIHLGSLSAGRDVLLSRILKIPPPAHVNITPDEVVFSLEEQEELHPYGMSVRYKAISKA
ncbi:MAG TPA: radical SAM protein, partial [Anaerolineales bacterium]|nr:radical SAM protein [Anaerolineales bacterium]